MAEELARGEGERGGPAAGGVVRGAAAAAEDAAREARRRRRRTWIILASISIGWKLVVFTLGAALPRWLIEDGIAELPAPHRAYGERAKQTAIGLWNGPIERHGFVRTVRVMSVGEAAAGDPLRGHPGAAAPHCEGLSARVRAYTYFAIPYSEVRTVCDTGVVEYRVFRRRKRLATAS